MKNLQKFKEIPLAEIEILNFNPNEQSEETFNQLVETIKQEGFDEPIQVAPKELEKYRQNPDNYKSIEFKRVK